MKSIKVLVRNSIVGYFKIEDRLVSSLAYWVPLELAEADVAAMRIEFATFLRALNHVVRPPACSKSSL